MFIVTDMRIEHIPQVIEVERQSFPTLWPANAYHRELQNRTAKYLVALQVGNAGPPDQGSELSGQDSPPINGRRLHYRPWWDRLPGRARTPESRAEVEHTVVGFIGMWLIVDEAHITTIAVRESLRRRGLGELLLLAALDHAIARGAERATLEVRASNFSAQALYEKYGFAQDGIRKGYYTDNHEDALIMTVSPMTSPAYRQRFTTLRKAYLARWGSDRVLPSELKSGAA